MARDSEEREAAPAGGDDDVVADFDETTKRDLATDDPATDVTRGDLFDLNNP